MLELNSNSSTEPALPNNICSPNFSRIFGTNTSAFELLVLKRKIMGPCWLQIKNPVVDNKGVSAFENTLIRKLLKRSTRYRGVRSKRLFRIPKILTRSRSRILLRQKISLHLPWRVLPFGRLSTTKRTSERLFALHHEYGQTVSYLLCKVIL